VFNTGLWNEFQKESNDMQLPEHLRDPLDFKTTNAVLQDNVLSAFSSMPPVEYGDYRLEISDPAFQNRREFSKKEQKQAILQRGEVSLPIKGTLRLIDKTTNLPVAEKRTTLMRLPYLTERGTFVRPGGEYTLAMQKRLRPGVYTRQTNAGEFESFIKTKAGSGFNFVMNPESGELYFKLYNSKTPAYAVMRGAGMTDDEIKDVLGKELYQTNYVDDYRNHLQKIWKKLTYGRRETQDVDTDLPKLFQEMELDEETTAKTLGESHRTVDPMVIRAAVANLLKTYRGERDPDDRDSFSFQQVLGPEDYFKEGILSDKLGVLKSILYKAQTTKNLDHVSANLFKPVTDFVFNTSRLALTPETPNPMDALDGNLKLTGMGAGGFASNEGVPDSSRLLSGTQLGTVDIVRSPESTAVGIDSRLALNTYKGRDNKLYTRFLNRNGETEYLPSSSLDSHVIAFPGELERAAKGAQQKVRALTKGQLDYVDPQEVDYVLPSGQQMFSLGANLIPFIGGVKGMRALMGAKYSVTADTQILVRRSDSSIYVGPVSSYVWSSGDQAMSIDRPNKVAKWLPVRGVSNHKNVCKIFEVQTASGRRVKATHHHSFVRLSSKTGDLEEVYTEDLRPGDRLPCVPFLPMSDRLGYEKFRITCADILTVDERQAEILGTVFRLSSSCNTSRYNPGLDTDYGKSLLEFCRTHGVGIDSQSNACLRTLYDTFFPRLLSELLLHRKSVRQAFVEGCFRSVSRFGKPKSVLMCESRSTAELLACVLSSAGVWCRLSGNEVKISRTGFLGRVKYGVHRQRSTTGAWRKSGVVFDPVVRITECCAEDYQTVYDLHMDDNLFWCAAGLLVHNTTQSVSLPARQAPLVQTVDGDGNVLHRMAAERVGAVYAKQGGKVISANPEELLVEYDDGTRDHIELYDRFPLNRKSQMTQTPIVEVGQRFEADQPIVDSNYTSGGLLSLGTHLHAAYMGMRGMTHEDSQTISESAAKKLSSTNMYTEKLDLDDTTSTDLGQFMSIFGGVYKKDQLKNLDDQGVAVPGAVLHKGDPIILNMKRRTNKGLGMIGGGKGNMWKDSTITWDRDYEGQVTDVWKDKSGLKVAISSDVPMQVGDKMCFTEDHSIYTSNRGWVGVNELRASDVCMTLDLDRLVVSESNIESLHAYPCREDLFVIEHEFVQTKVTLNHRIPVSFDGMHFSLYTAKELLQSESFWMLAGPQMMPVFISVEDNVCLERHEGWVFCPTLCEHHTLLVKYGHTIHWSGNSNLYGGKGVIGSILPDDQMPKDSQGRPFDLLINPYGIVSRHNPAQIAEMLLAKVAEHTGKSYQISAFEDYDIMDFVEDELKKHGVSPTDDVQLPEGRMAKGILTGSPYYMRLHHNAADKESGVGEGGYTMVGTPTREEGGDKPKRVGTLEMDALVAHGSTDVIKDVKLVKGQENREFFKDIMDGKQPPAPKISPMYRKFIATLQAAGVRVNPVNEGRSLQLVAMTDTDVQNMSSGEITNPETVKWKSKYSRDLRGDADLSPVDGGLFDRGITGGMGGNRWSHISLPERVPNPVYEKSIRSMLGLTENELRQVMSGQRDINGFGTGPRALEAALNHLDTDRQLEALKAQYKVSDKPSVKDKLAKQIRAYQGVKNMGIRPRDLLTNKVLVIPPVFRPVSITPGFEIISDANMLYKDLLDAGDNFKKISEVAGQDMSGEALLSVYDAYKAVTGLGDPVKKERVQKGVKGLLKDIFGPSGNKTSIVQRNLIGTPASYSSRGVITPDPNLSMDEIGVPEDKAWEMFHPFVVRRLIQGTTGSPEEKKRALKAVSERQPVARDALLKEMSERPVLYSRAPVLHKYGMIAGYAVPVPGHAIRVNIPTMKGFNADFDGNCIAGSSKIVVNFPLTPVPGVSYSTATVYDELMKEYKMLVSGDTKIVAITDQSVAVEMSICHVPRIEDTMVYDRNGGKVYDTPEMCVWTIDPDTGEIKMGKVTSLTEEYVEGVCKIETKSGHFVEASDNESLRVFDPVTGCLVKAKADESALGAVMAHAAVMPTYGTLHDPELGWWIGAFLSDGFFTGNSITDLGYAKVSSDHQDRFKAVIDRMDKYRKMTEHIREEAKDGDFGPNRKRHYYGLSFLNTIAQDCYNRDVPWDGRSCLYKKLPGIVKWMDKETLMGLFAGLVDGDGSLSRTKAVSKKKSGVSLSFSSSSPYLVKDVSELCQKLGFRSSVVEYQPTNKTSRLAYLVSVSIMDVIREKHLIRLCGDANDLLQSLVLGDFKDDRDLVPVPESLATLYSSTSGPCNGSPTKATLATSRTPTKRSKGVGCKVVLVSRNTALELIRLTELWDGEYDKELFGRWKQLVLSTKLHWTFVTKVSRSAPQLVYDLAVDTGVFIANGGLLVEDTMNLHAIATQKAVEDAKERMLPSRHLFSTSDFKLMHQPVQEFNMGLYLLGKRKSGRLVTERKFGSAEAVRQAYARGEIDLSDDVVVESQEEQQ